MAIRNIGIMTGGGDCPGLNPVIRAVVKTAARYGWRVLGLEDAFSGLVDLDYRSPHGNRWLDDAAVRMIHTRGGTILGTSNRSNPFAFPVKAADGTVSEQDVFDRVLDHWRRLDLDALISVGGDGSMAIAQQAIDRGLTNIVGVPKTIDNDLGATDATFGFDTAVGTATAAIDRLRDTAESHDRVMLVEVMGRHAGWIALHAGLAGGAHAVLIPEIPYRLAPIARAIEARRAAGQPYSIVVVAEGAVPAEGEPSFLAERESGGMRRLFGAAGRVAEGLAHLVELDLRATVLGHIQRGGSPSNFDRVLGSRFGEAAVHLVAKGGFGRMVALRGNDIVDVAIRDAIGQQKLVDPSGQLVRTARSLGVVFGDEP